MRTFTLDGNDFDTLRGFYQSMCVLLAKGDLDACRNLDALNDLLRGGFGVTAYGEPITLRWLNHEKSREDLGDDLMLTILTIMLAEGNGHDVKVILA